MVKLLNLIIMEQKKFLKLNDIDRRRIQQHFHRASKVTESYKRFRVFYKSKTRTIITI